MDKEAEELLARMDAYEAGLQQSSSVINESCNRLLDSISTFRKNVEEIDAEFERLTSLQKEDIPFVVFCAGLQAVRQYYITDFKKRLSDQDAAKEVKGQKKEESDRNKTRYYCSTENIIKNPVPFDAIEHDDKIRTGISGRNHRTKCLGHYPELGYIFGTANIMTSTITKKEGLANIQTYHVTTESITRQYTYKKTGETKTHTKDKDFINARAHTDKMFEHCYNRIKDNPRKGIPALLAALAKEHEHLRSDEKSKQSLPFPFLSFTPEIAESLREYGLDYINVKTVAKQAAYSCFVNLITEVLYYAYHVGKQIPNVKSASDIKINDLTKTRLKKIINVANVISTSTNLMAVIVGIFTSNLDLIRKWDVGGTFVTLHALSSSADYIIELKETYIKEQMKIKNRQVC